MIRWYYDYLIKGQERYIQAYSVIMFPAWFAYFYVCHYKDIEKLMLD